jgi:DNA-binding beta-propeller fold protein YncE
VDSDALWISSVSGNFVTRFNVTTKSFDLNLTGFDRPLGIEVTKDAVYVAENGASDTIAVINKTTLQITRIHTGAPVTNEGPYYVYKSILGNLWWTDNSKHFGVILSNGTKIFYESVSPYNYFISEIPGNTILFSCRGSVLTGIVKDIRITASQGSCGGLGGGWKAMK